MRYLCEISGLVPSLGKASAAIAHRLAFGQPPFKPLSRAFRAFVMAVTNARGSRRRDLRRKLHFCDNQHKRIGTQPRQTAIDPITDHQRREK
jgi:hypothetical protein